MKSLTNLTAAFVIHADFSKYKIYNLIHPNTYIQERAEIVNIQVKIKAKSGKWRPFGYISTNEYTHVIEVYGNDTERLLGVRRAIGNLLSSANPGYGYCRRCHIIWSSAKSHITNIEGGDGCFCLCEWCWGQLTPEQRLPYYEVIILNWESMTYKPINAEEKKRYAAIRTAVLAGE